MKHRLKISGSLIGGLILAPICFIQWLLTGKNLGFILWRYFDNELENINKKGTK